jgi:hypothetical protein
MHTYIHIYIHAYTDTYTHALTYMHTHTHTYACRNGIGGISHMGDNLTGAGDGDDERILVRYVCLY